MFTMSASFDRRRVGGRAVRLSLLAAVLVGLAAGLWWSAESVRADDGPPGRPHTLTVTPLHQGLRVYWHAPASDGGSAVTGYDVHYRADQRVTWTDAAHQGLDQPAVITGLAFHTGYQVRVRAVNASGAGPWSQVVWTLTSRDNGAPDPPLPPTITPGDGELALSWRAPAYTGAAGKPITGYRVIYTTDLGATWRFWSPGGRSLITSASTTITGLRNGVRVGVAVAAVNSRGQSRYSAHTPLAEAVPAPLLTLKLESAAELCTANTQIELRAKISGGIAPYALTVDGKSVAANADSHRVSCGLLATDSETGAPLPNQSKTFSASATDARGVTATAELTIPLASPPARPLASTLHAAAFSQAVQVSWDAIAARPAVSGYALHYQSIDWRASDWPSAWMPTGDTLDADQAEYRHADLDPDRRYRYRLRATNSVGAGQWSPAFPAVGVQPRPGAPALTAQTAASGSVKLSWTGGPQSTVRWEYRQYLSMDAGWGDWTPIPGATVSTASFTVSGLVQDRRYQFQVRAVNAGGDGVASETAGAVAGLSPTVPSDRETLFYDSFDSNGGAAASGSYAFLKSAADLTSGATTFAQVSKAQALLLNTSGYQGRDYASVLTAANVGDRITWFPYGSCWYHFRITGILTDPAPPARKLFRLVLVTEDACGTTLNRVRSKFTWIEWNDNPPSEPDIGPDGIRVMPTYYAVSGGHSYRLAASSPVVIEVPAEMRLRKGASMLQSDGSVYTTFVDESSNGNFSIDPDSGTGAAYWVPVPDGARQPPPNVVARFKALVSSVKLVPLP